MEQQPHSHSLTPFQTCVMYEASLVLSHALHYSPQGFPTLRHSLAVIDSLEQS